MGDSWRTTWPDTIAERTTPVVELTLTDSAGVAVPAADMTSITLTLCVRRTGNIINSRSGVDVLNATIGTYHATSGLLTLSLTAADTVRELATGTPETHVALITYTWQAGTKVGRHEVVYSVADLAKVP